MNYYIYKIPNIFVFEIHPTSSLHFLIKVKNFLDLNLSKKTNRIRNEIDVLKDEKKATVASVNRAINIIKLGETANKLSKFPPAI